MIHQRWFQVTVVMTTLLVISLIIGTILQSNATAHDMTLYPPPGELIKVNGSDMHIYCIGEGSPTVLFEAGLGGNYMDWVLVQPHIAKLTRTCAYDRSGMGYSDYFGTPLNTDATANRLHQLLTETQITGPYILVGHSIGGIHVRSFYELYPEDVVGMVLVDSSHENQGQYLPTPPAIVDTISNIVPLLARIGVLRGLGIADQNIVTDHLTPEQITQVSAMVNRTAFWQALEAEHQMAKVDTNQHIAPVSMDELPLIVISQDIAGIEETDPEMANLWLELQYELATLSTDGRHIIAENSGHYVHYDQPQIIIDSILGLLNTSHN